MKKVLLVLLTLIIFVVSCGKKENSNVESDVIRIAVPQPLTGELSQYGVAIANGIELRAKEINENGGLLGKKIELHIVDTKGNLQEAVNSVKDLISNKNIDFILGEAISSNSSAVAAIAQAAKIPMITPAGTAFDITEGKDYVFRATFTDPYQGVAIAKKLNEKNYKNVAILTNSSNDYSVGISDSFKEESQKLGLTVKEFKYTSDDKDFKSILTNLKNLNVEAVVIPDYYNTVGLILSQSREVGVNTEYYGGDGWDTITTNFADVAEGAIYASQFSVTDTDEKVQDFIKKYMNKYDSEPSIFGALGYDAMMILEKAILSANSLDKEVVKNKIKETNDDFITGHIVYDSNNNPEKIVKFLKVEKGKTVIDK